MTMHLLGLTGQVYSSTKNEKDGGRGIHAVILSQSDGQVLAHQIFDTYAGDEGGVR